MSGRSQDATTVRENRRDYLHLTIPVAYEFASQMLGDEDQAAVLVAGVLEAGHDINGPLAHSYLQGWVLNQLYRQAARIKAATIATSEPANPLSILSPERRAAVVAHDVMGLDRANAALVIGVSRERFGEVLGTARVAIRDYLSGLGLI